MTVITEPFPQSSLAFLFFFLQTTKRSWRPPNLIVNTWKHPSRHRNHSKNIIHWWCPLPNWLPGEKCKGKKNSSLPRDGLVIWRLGNPLGCWEVISWLNRAGSYLVHCHGWFGLWWITAGWQLDSGAPKRRCTSEEGLVSQLQGLRLASLEKHLILWGPA